MDRRMITIFGLAAMVAALVWMGWHKDFIGIFVSIVVGAAIAFLANKIELRKK